LEGQYRFDFETDSAGAQECASGGGWSQEPGGRWCCDSLRPITGRSSLYHCFDNSQEGCDYLVFRHDPLNTRDSFAFSFRIRHGFLPSSMNNWQLALGATFEDEIRSGLVLGINYTGSDDLVKIWHVDQGISRVICSTGLNYQEEAGSEKAPYFRVEGDGRDKLALYWSPDPHDQLPELLDSCRMDGISWGRQLLLRYRYSSSRDRALWLDELLLEGKFEKDTLAPELSSLNFLDAATLQLDFSEELGSSDSVVFILYSDHYPGGRTPEVVHNLGAGFLISFAEAVPNRMPCRLWIGGVRDGDGNVMEDTTIHVLRNEAAWGDVVFNEIMADPEPAIRQVDEYLELYNRSAYPLKLEGWQLQVNERSYLLDASAPAGTGTGTELLPGDFLLLTQISLPNEGARLSLYSREGTLIHAASYRIPWDGPAWKKEGGWSLESPDADLPCRISYNWEYSADPGGGTPGWANSNRTVLEDRKAPVLLYGGLGNPGEFRLHYNEPLNEIQKIRNDFLMDPGAERPDSVRLLHPLKDILSMHFPPGFQQWPLYRLSVPGASDCAGNPSEDQVFQAGALKEPLPGSVLINEIMYDPEEGKPEYVELFVPGQTILDLQDLAIHLVEYGGIPEHPVPLADHSRLVLPGQYLVISECVPHLREAYGLEESGQWVEVADLNRLNNNQACIYLTDRAGNVVDMAVYSKDLHMDLLDDARGVSLERISVQRPGDDPGNWHSAASIAGYATPGRKNSQSRGEMDAEGTLHVWPEVFSPDNDGHEDLLEITINTGGNNWVIGVWVSDLHGNRIRILANNHLAGPSVSYTWDGEGEDGAIQPMGFYVIHARGYHTATGEQWIRRKAVGLVFR